MNPESDEAKTLFLEELALMGEADEMSGESGALSLMTLHAAKGLEFAAVGVVGVQEGLVPLGRSKDDPAGLDEERRLLYVGVTRAKKTLVPLLGEGAAPRWGEGELGVATRAASWTGWGLSSSGAWAIMPRPGGAPRAGL